MSAKVAVNVINFLDDEESDISLPKVNLFGLLFLRTEDIQLQFNYQIQTNRWGMYGELIRPHIYPQIYISFGVGVLNEPIAQTSFYERYVDDTYGVRISTLFFITEEPGVSF